MRRPFGVAIVVAVAFAGICLTVGLPLLLRHYVVQAYKIPAGSMMPTLLVGDHILVDKLRYRTHEVERGDIVVFRFPKDRSVDFVKRVVGLPGESIAIRGDTVYIDDAPIVEEYASYLDPGPDRDFDRHEIPEDSVFVLGDNRDNSYDSRFWGPVPRGDIKGKVTFIYWSIDEDAGRGTRWERLGTRVR